MRRSLLVRGCLLWMVLAAGCQRTPQETVLTSPPEDGRWPSNPFVIPNRAPYPRIEVPETTHDFGMLAVLREARHSFVIHNVGEVPVKLAMGKTTCQCTLSNLANEELLPGESTEVELVWTPRDDASEFAQSATIWTNAPEQSAITFMVTGQILPQVTIMPGNSWNMGPIGYGETGVIDGMAYSLVHPEFELLEVVPSHDWMNVSFRQAIEEEPGSARTKSIYVITCEVLPEGPLGDFRGTLTLKTNLETDIYSEILVTVSGSRSGPFNITGPGWSSRERAIVELGRVSASEGKVHQLSLIIPPMGEPLSFSHIETDPEFLQFELVRDENYPATNRERYHLIFTIPPGSPEGYWRGVSAGHVTAQTNLDERKELRIQVEFEVVGSN